MVARSVVGPMRVPFLILAPACVLVGVGTALWTQGRVAPGAVVLAFIGGITAHIAVNALNEYVDFRSGLDFRTVPTPFSGGSGTLPREPGLARSALIIALAAAALTAAIGLYFVIQSGLALLPLGIAGLVVIFTYTSLITRSPILCLIAPGLGFGPLIVLGTDFVLTGHYSWTAFVASLVPFFLVSNLLLLNQFPDAEADRTVGRKHLPIAAGKRTSSVVYGLFLAATYLSVIVGVAAGLLPALSLVALLTAPIALRVAVGVYQHAEETPALLPYLGQNVILNIATPVLLAIGLLIAA